MFYTYVGSNGSNVVHRYIKDGKSFTEKANHKYDYYLSDVNGEYNCIDGSTVSKRTADSPRELKNIFKEYKGITDVYGMDTPEIQFINAKYPEEINFSFNDLHIMNVDIETEIGKGFPDPTKAEQAINAITAMRIGHPHSITWTTVPYDRSKDEEADDNSLVFVCGSEAEIMLGFLEYIRRMEPHAITGYNIAQFDIPYLVNRMKKVIGDAYKQLSPIAKHMRNPIREKTNRVTGETEYIIEGMPTLDYLELIKKFDFTRYPDYKLETICQEVLGTGKVDYGEYATLKEFYENEPTKFIRYNIKDVELVNQLDASLNFLQLSYVLQYSAKCNTADIFGQVRFWDYYIYSYLLGRDYVIPPLRSHDSDTIEGAYVAEPKIGKSKWVVSFDLTSLYPMTMMQYNMGIDTIVSKECRRPGLLEDLVNLADIPEIRNAHANNVAMAANGATFSKGHQGLLSCVVEILFGRRKGYQKELKAAQKEYEQTKDPALHARILMLNAFQMAMKIAINSLYGACGNVGFRYYDHSIAEGITQSGQLAIKYISRRINEYLNDLLGMNIDWIVAGDTDSVYISLEPLVQRLTHGKPYDTESMVNIIDKFCQEKLGPFIDSCYDELAKYMNAFVNKMIMKREVISDAAIFRAKKNYIMHVLDSEGIRYSTPKLKTMGVETARSTTPKFVKDALLDCYRIMLTSDNNKDLTDYIRGFESEYHKREYHDIATPRSVNDMSKWITADGKYINRCPYHVKASHEYNRMLDKCGLVDYGHIQDASRIRLLLLKKNNIIEGNYIAYVNDLPAEFGLDNLIDYPEMLNKTFLSPVNSFASLLNWQIEETGSIADFFA